MCFYTNAPAPPAFFRCCNRCLPCLNFALRGFTPCVCVSPWLGNWFAFIALTVAGPLLWKSLIFIALTVSTAWVALVIVVKDEDDGVTAAAVEGAGEADAWVEVSGATADEAMADETTDEDEDEETDVATMLAMDSAAELPSELMLILSGLPGLAW